jgi:hypothetical protein
MLSVVKPPSISQPSLTFCFFVVPSGTAWRTVFDPLHAVT